MNRPKVLLRFGQKVTLLLPDGALLVIGRALSREDGISAVKAGIKLTVNGRFSESVVRIVSALLADVREGGLLIEELAKRAFPSLGISLATKHIHDHVNVGKEGGLFVVGPLGGISLNHAYDWDARELDVASFLCHGDQRSHRVAGVGTGKEEELAAAIELQRIGYPKRAWSLLMPILDQAESDEMRLEVLPTLAGLAVELGRHGAAANFIKRTLSLTKGRAPSSASYRAHHLQAVLELQRRRFNQARTLSDAARDELSSLRRCQPYLDLLVGSCWLRSEVRQRSLLRDAPTINWTEKQTLKEARRLLSEGRQAAERLGSPSRLAEVPFRMAVLDLRVDNSAGLRSESVIEAKARQRDLCFLWSSALDRVLWQRALCDAADPAEVHAVAKALVEQTKDVAERGFAGQVVRAHAALARSRHFQRAEQMRASIARGHEGSIEDVAARYGLEFEDIFALRENPLLGAESVFEARPDRQPLIMEQQVREMRIDLALHAAGCR